VRVKNLRGTIVSDVNGAVAGDDEAGRVNAAPTGGPEAQSATAEINTVGIAEDVSRVTEPGRDDAPARETAQAKNDEPEGPSTTKRNPIFAHTGYVLPKSVEALYVARDGKFVERKSERIHFEDSGKKLSTTSEDRRVIENMIEVAKAKNWDRLELRGTEEFRRQAWITAELAGLESHGYKPTEQDHAVVQARREEMRISAGEKSAGKATENSVSVEAPARERDGSPAPAQAAESILSEKQQFALDSLKAIFDGRGDSDEAVAKALEFAQSRFVDDRVHAGRVLEHGAAPYNHDPDNSASYFVKLSTPSGDERTVWGVDLARNADEGLLTAGEDVMLVFRGKEPVTVPTEERDAQGQKTGRMIEITTHRNTWEVTEAGKLIEQATARETATEQRDVQSAAGGSSSSNRAPSPEQLASFEAEFPPERRAAIAAEIAAEREAEQRREQEQRVKDTIARHANPAYREAYAKEFLRSVGRDPDEFFEPGADQTTATATTPANGTPAAPAERERGAASEPQTAGEAALRAVLESELDKRGVPEDQRGVQRANLEAAITNARATGQDLSIPEPLTVDRSVQVAHTQAIQVEQTRGNPSVEINH
jgi:hypothetical protein